MFYIGKGRNLIVDLLGDL